MQLTEQHIIDCNDPRYQAIDKAAFASKNLYNATLYIVRQIFIFEDEYLNCNTMDQVMQKHEAYRGLPTKVVFNTEGVEDGKARFSHALVVHPVRKVVVPSRSQKGKS
jgi:putative transposase